jgi:L-seryl-tRNA(Ser) seleniumtransferase
MNDVSAQYRKLPSVDELLRDERTASLLDAYPRSLVADAFRKALSDARSHIAEGEKAPDHKELIDAAERALQERSRLSLRRAVNATGIIIHTGLGRAVLSQCAIAALEQAASGHSTLEIDPTTGKRGSRQEHVRDLLVELTDAENALVVNNNAAAVFLVINTLAKEREVIISRGQLVEIGDSFRLPEIITAAGAELVEVGTTNRTRFSDYEYAVTDRTALILRCHPSNFRITGFTEEVPLGNLVELGRKLGIPVMDDLGSGALVNVSQFGLEPEPTAQESIRTGADVVCFSGDKLLGGPQAGILLGRADIVARCRSNPIARTVRIDKLTLAALEATLRIYRDGDPVSDIPTLASISRPLTEIKRQAEKLSRKINSLHIPGLQALVVRTESETGGGSLPGRSLDSFAVTLKSEALSANDLGERFRGHEPPIFGRIFRDMFLLDMRTVAPQEIQDILGCVQNLA